MNTLRKASLSALGLLAAFVLAGCSLLTPTTPVDPVPSQTPVVTIPLEDFNDTTWAGADSEGLDTVFVLHAGGTTGVTYGGGTPYDDPADAWVLEGSTLTITIHNVALPNSVSGGVATYVGEVTDSAGPIDLALTFSNVTQTRTLTITKGA
jgi:hypothetical protein